MYGVICSDDQCRPLTHIRFTCPNHPEKIWYTKNIPMRSWFYNLANDPAMGPECDCFGTGKAKPQHLHGHGK